MEEENQVFGKDAEAVDSNINLESEDFYFYHQNKEEAKKNIDSSSADLSDFIDSLIQDIPDPSAEEVNSGIEKILERTHPTEEHSKTNKKKKVAFKVLFIAALLSMISFSCLYVVGSSHNISIENGFVSFAKDTIQVVFFGKGEEEYITVDTLLADLEAHGYEDILFPQEFVNNYDVYKVSVPEYKENELVKQFMVDIHSDNITYYFSMNNCQETQLAYDYVGLKNVETIDLNGCCIYVFEFNGGSTSIEFIHNGYYYYINGYTSYSDMVQLAKTIK